MPDPVDRVDEQLLRRGVEALRACQRAQITGRRRLAGIVRRSGDSGDAGDQSSRRHRGELDLWAGGRMRRQHADAKHGRLG
jgi:hypothetical protein